ncbi:hypothetical protein HOLleu_14212 [Holothuria leucospilota]|uniref:IgGFc-binding protein N-terminal domain-containing protein n=1 Tax=Holothuria leucospilota TaxID=206669 RepID=A0A9Q1C889_HOLLE|nr:hypothetical protein HOLleu_14212 [Holothuria leucospilota]
MPPKLPFLKNVFGYESTSLVFNTNYDETSQVELKIANQPGSLLESLSECFLDVTGQSIASISFDFMENPNFTGDDLTEYLFAFTFIDIYCPTTAARQIYIGTTRLTGTSGRIYFPSQNVSDINFVLGPGEGHFLQLPANYQRPHEDDSGLLINSTVVVTANDSIVIYAYQGCADEFGQQASSFRVQERQRLGTDYWVLTHFRKSPAHLGIVAVENNTSVAISFNHTNGNFEMRQQDITMNMYDTFYLVLPFDATGTQITSNKKVSVIVGVSSIILSQGSRNTEPFCETLEPIFNWGKAFSVAHFLGPEKSNDYIVKFISAVDNNTVHWKQGPYKTETTLQQGQSKELLVTANITDVLEINSSKNILVAQFATRGDPVFTNPAMTFIPPHTDGLEDKIMFPIFDLSYEENVTNYLTVWVPPMEHLSNVSIDSICTDWRIFGGHDSGWKIFKKALKAGSHILRVKNGFKVRAMVFSAAQKRSCAYPIA